jgi:hypothetical protein
VARILVPVCHVQGLHPSSLWSDESDLMLLADLGSDICDVSAERWDHDCHSQISSVLSRSFLKSTRGAATGEHLRLDVFG